MDEHRRLTVVAALAALAALPAGLARAAAQPQAPAAQSEPVQTVQAPASTPEELGDSLMMHQRYQAAIAAYKNGPHDSANLWNKLGIAYQMMFNLEDAMRCYQASLKLEPKNTRVMNNLGTVYDAMRQFSAAERMYRKSLKLEPTSAMVEKNLGTNLLAQHKYKKGWEAYQAALAIDPQIFQSNSSPRVENPAAVQDRGAMNFYMAKSCARAGMTDKAIDYLRMALNEGFTTPKKIIEDKEFASLRGIPAFEQLLAAQHAP
jgi:Flp pilus assembly protein TadD